MGYFNCQVCLSQNTNGNCLSDATICVTMRKFTPRCKGYQPLCNPLAGAFVAASTVCQQALFTGTESTVASRTITPNYTFTVTSANATAGTVYSTTNGAQFTVLSTIAAGTVLMASSSSVGIPFGTTLTKVSGSGDASITFSAAVHNGTQSVVSSKVGDTSPYNGGTVIASCSGLVDTTQLSPLGFGQVV